MTKTLEQHRDIQYHSNCECFYVTEANKLPEGSKARERALSNAEYHRRHVESLRVAVDTPTKESMR